MWISKNRWDTYGYQNPNSFMKGNYENRLLPYQCYQIKDKNPGKNEDQFHVIPVDSQGHEIGPAVIKTSGVSMGYIWNKGKDSRDFNISDAYLS
jgi:hypothetical protein